MLCICSTEGRTDTVTGETEPCGECPQTKRKEEEEYTTGLYVLYVVEEQRMEGEREDTC